MRAALPVPAIVVALTTGSMVGAALVAALSLLFGALAFAALHWNDDEPDNPEEVPPVLTRTGGFPQSRRRRCRKNEGGF